MNNYSFVPAPFSVPPSPLMAQGYYEAVNGYHPSKQHQKFSSTEVIPHRQRRIEGDDTRHTRNLSRSVSPSYAPYDSHRKTRSPVSTRYNHDYGRRSRDRSPRSFDNRRRIYANGGLSDSESDEGSKGLNYEEYRRLKREKMRKSLKRSIWNVTPSPPGSDWEKPYPSDEEKKYGEKKVEDERKRSSSSESELEKSDSSIESDSKNFESESSDSRRRSEKGMKRNKKSIRSKRKRIRYSDSDTDSSEDVSDSGCSEEGDRKQRKKLKSKERSRQEKNRRKRSSRKKISGRRKRRDSGSDKTESESSSSSIDRKRMRKRSKSTSGRDKSRSESSLSDRESGLDVQVIEKDVSKLDDTKKTEVIESQNIDVDNEPLVGPPRPSERMEAGHVSYGGALRPGEGDAIAQYVQQGKRIPRRGEVGLTAEEIERFEKAGYVMSGNRHARMNAIRIRKENQVYSAQDKRALAMYNYEERAKREHKVMADLKKLVACTIGPDE